MNGAGSRSAGHGASRRALPLLVALACAGFAGCASRSPGRDSADARPPANLLQVPDAQPRVEPLRVGGPNKPYDALGQRYVPLTSDLPLAEAGGASWYGRKFHGLPTASGEPYDMYAMTAAHRTMPIPSYARVRNPANGREVVVRINDRGPFSAGRVIDLSYTAALKLGLLAGVAPVEVQRLTFADIRAGAGGRSPSPMAQADAAAAFPSSPPSPPPPAARPGLAPPALAIAAPDDAPPPVQQADAAAAPPRPPAAPGATVPDDPLPGDKPGAAPGFWLQVGAYRLRDGALQLQQRVLRDADAVPGVAVLEDGGWFRVQAGPFDGRWQAQQAAERLRRQLGLPVLLVERTPPP